MIKISRQYNIQLQGENGMSHYPIDVNEMIKLLESAQKRENLSEERKKRIKGLLAYFYSLKEQGITETDTSKVKMKDIAKTVGLVWKLDS